MSTVYVVKVGHKYLTNDRHSGYPYLDEDESQAATYDTTDDVEREVNRYLKERAIKFDAYEILCRSEVVVKHVQVG